jgi:hypothetical protein
MTGDNAMSKKTKKLSLKKETLRTLSAEQLAQANGGADYSNVALPIGGVRPPPPGTFGCTETFQYYNYSIKGY